MGGVRVVVPGMVLAALVGIAGLTLTEVVLAYALLARDPGMEVASAVASAEARAGPAPEVTTS